MRDGECGLLAAYRYEIIDDDDDDDDITDPNCIISY